MGSLARKLRKHAKAPAAPAPTIADQVAALSPRSGFYPGSIKSVTIDGRPFPVLTDTTYTDPNPPGVVVVSPETPPPPPPMQPITVAPPSAPGLRPRPTHDPRKTLLLLAAIAGMGIAAGTPRGPR